MAQSHTLGVPGKRDGSGSVPAREESSKVADQAKAAKESTEQTVSKPGGFDNDPNDPTNPNEAIERHRRKLRP
jgi:hypothetical protein